MGFSHRVVIYDCVDGVFFGCDVCASDDMGACELALSEVMESVGADENTRFQVERFYRLVE